MRSRIAALALLTALAAACSSASSGGSGPAPTRPAPSPTYTQLGTLAVSEVVDTIRFTGTSCPKTLPEVELEPGQVVACDPQPRHAYVLAEPALGERSVEATTVAREPGGDSWTAYLQLSRSGTRAFAEIGGPYAIVYNGVVVTTAPAVTPGGYLQIPGLSKQKAHRIAKALNPS